MLPNLRSPMLAALTISATSAVAASEPTVRLPKYIVEESAGGLGATATVLSSSDWQGRTITTLGDAIGHTPGLLLQESFGGFEPPRLSIRGSGMQSAPSSRGLSLTLDNLPLNLADGSFNSALLAPQIAERIEVSRGFDAWSASPATMGGVINLCALQTPKSAVHTEIGSFGAMRTNATCGLKSGNVTATGFASFELQDGYRTHSAQHRPIFFTSLRRPTFGTGATSVSFFYIHPVYDVPGPLTLAAAGSAPRSTSSDVTRDQPRREAELWRIAVNTHGQTTTFHYNAGLAYQHNVDWFRQLQANGISDSQSDDLSLSSGITAPFEIIGLQNQFRAETNAARGWRDLKRFVNNASQTGNRFGRDGLYATTATLTIKDTINVSPSLTATAGYSRVYARRDIVDHQPEISSTTTRSQNQPANVTAASLQWTPRPEQTVFIRLLQNDEPPTFDDLLFVAGSYPNLVRRSQALQSQRATTVELGTKGQLGRISWTLTSYRSEWHNEILRLADANGSPRGAVNAGKTLHTGLETSLRWRLIDQGQRLSLNAQGNWGLFTFDNDPVYRNNRLAGMPPCLGSAELLYEHPCGFFAASSVNWTAGQTPVDHASRLTYGGHTLASLRSGWKLRTMWRFYLDIHNVFDRQHIASTAGVLDLARNPAATAVFLPGNGRSITVGFEWSP